jgi:hypothetical protein
LGDGAQEELSEAEVGESAGEYRKALRAAAAEAVRGRLPDNKWVAAVGGELLAPGKTAAAGEQMLALALHKHCAFIMRGHLTDLDLMNTERSGAPSTATVRHPPASCRDTPAASFAVLRCFRMRIFPLRHLTAVEAASHVSPR